MAKKKQKASAKKAAKKGASKRPSKKKKSSQKKSQVINLKTKKFEDSIKKWKEEFLGGLSELKPIFLSALLIAIVLTGLLGLFANRTNGKSAFNVVVWDLELGQLTESEIRDTIKQRFEAFLGSSIRFEAGEKMEFITPGELGFKLDQDTLVEDVLDTGRSTGFWETQNKLLASLSKTTNLTPLPDADVETIFATIYQKFPEIRQPKDVEITFIPSLNDFRITDEEEGLVVENREEILDRLTEMGLILSARDVRVGLTKKDPILTREHAIKALKDVSAYSAKIFKFLNNHNEYRLPLTKNKDFFEFIPSYTEGEEGLIAQISQEKLDGFFDEYLRPTLEKEALHPTLEKNDQGEYVLEGFGQNGVEVNTKKTWQAMMSALANGENSIPIELEVEISTVQSEQENDLGITTLIGAGNSDFKGSPRNRIHNITVGIEKFNNVIVAPGEEFVFGEVLGPVDGSTGYKKELVIKEGGKDTLPEYGGGICQVSTTAFRAALNSGLPISQRRPHSYNVVYYKPAGLDATVYPPSVDLKFVNDTPGHIMLQTRVDAKNRLAYFNVYGTDDGRSVELSTTGAYNYITIEEPHYEETDELPPGEVKLKEHGGKKTGFDVKWFRTITYADGETKDDVFFSRYKAFPDFYLKGKEDDALIAEGGDGFTQ